MRGSARPSASRIIQHQVIRHKLVDMAQRIEASQAMLEMLTWRVEQGENPVAEICMLKNQATTTLAFCASEGVQIFGGAGFLRGAKVERIYREVKVNAIGARNRGDHEGSGEPADGALTGEARAGGRGRTRLRQARFSFNAHARPLGDSSTVELRTSDSVNLGSNPGPPAKQFQQLMRRG